MLIQFWFILSALKYILKTSKVKIMRLKYSTLIITIKLNMTPTVYKSLLLFINVLFIYGTFKSKNIFFKHSSPFTVEHKIGPN